MGGASSDAPSPTGQKLVAGPVRWLLMLIGFVSLGIGAIGVVIPVLPTTIFLLIAAACFARSSPRAYAWLLNNRTFGPFIRDWREHGAIPIRAKVLAVSMIVVVGGASVVWFIDNTVVRAAVAAVLVAVIAFIVTRPSSPPSGASQRD